MSLCTDDRSVCRFTCCLFADKYKTHKYSVDRANNCWMLNLLVRHVTSRHCKVKILQIQRAARSIYKGITRIAIETNYLCRSETGNVPRTYKLDAWNLRLLDRGSYQVMNHGDTFCCRWQLHTHTHTHMAQIFRVGNRLHNEGIVGSVSSCSKRFYSVVLSV
jgi:hypothetical protein